MRSRQALQNITQRQETEWNIRNGPNYRGYRPYCVSLPEQFYDVALVFPGDIEPQGKKRFAEEEGGILDIAQLRNYLVGISRGMSSHHLSGTLRSPPRSSAPSGGEHVIEMSARRRGAADSRPGSAAEEENVRHPFLDVLNQCNTQADGREAAGGGRGRSTGSIAGERESVSLQQLQFMIRTTILSMLESMGCFINLETKSFQGVNEWHCKARLTEEACKVLAAAYEYPLRVAREQWTHDDGDSISEGERLVPFSFEISEEYWMHYDGMGRCMRLDGEAGSLFRDIDRIRLLTWELEKFIDIDQILTEHTFSITSESPLTGGKKRRVKFLGLKDFYNLHKRYVQTYITGAIDDNVVMASYFGERISLYFEWMALLSTSYRTPALLGSLLFILNELVVPIVAFPLLRLVFSAAYLLYLVLWTENLLNDWKHVQRRFNIQHVYEKRHSTVPTQKRRTIQQPSTYPVVQRDPSTMYHSGIGAKGITANRTYGSFCTLWIFVSLIVCLSVSFYLRELAFNSTFRFSYQDVKVFEFDIMALASVLQSLLVVFFDLLWAWIVKRSYSNHSLCVKTIVFKSLNHFLPLFYSALVHPTEISPYQTFQTQLVMQFGLIIVADVTELAVPYLTLVYKKSSCRRSTAAPTAEAERLLSPSVQLNGAQQPQRPFRATVTPPSIGPIRFSAEEAEYLMGHYDETNLADDYLEAVIQFTHLLFFSPCCPIIALFTLLRHNIEIYTDKIKLCRLFKRSCLMHADDQIYTNILRIISTLALPTSLSMLLYFDPVLTFKQKLITFIILEYAMVSVRLYFHFTG